MTDLTSQEIELIRANSELESAIDRNDAKAAVAARKRVAAAEAAVATKPAPERDAGFDEAVARKLRMED